jgi:hypothetical protein
MNLRRTCNKNKCTCWFDNLWNWDWSECCEQHDNDIINGLTSGWLEANNKLFKCVAKRCKIMAILMYIGVTPMGAIFWYLYRSGKIK